MNAFEIRPRFRLTVEESPEAVAEQFRQALKLASTTVSGRVLPGHVTLKLPVTQRHYWSPQLDLDIEKSDNQCLIRGLMGPAATVWAFFSFCYAIMGFAMLAGLIVGMSQWTLGTYSVFIWLLPAGAVGCILLYLVSQAGKKISQKEMHILYNFVLQTLAAHNPQLQTS